MTSRLLPLIFAATTALASLSSHAAGVAVHDYDVYVDPPTAFVYVKLPQGWKFVGKLDEVRLDSLPANVHTALLDPADRASERVAEADAPAKR